MLLILLSVTDIQVLHSHSSNNIFSRQSKSHKKHLGLPEYHCSGAESNCFICEYQVTKDVDAHHAIINFIFPLQYQSISGDIFCSIIFKPASLFENRGPPYLG